VVNIDPESVERVTIGRDLQATTQPTKRDASKSTVVLARRAEKFAPDGPPAPAPEKKPGDAAKPADPAAGPKSDASSTSVEGEAVLAAAQEKANAPKDGAANDGAAAADAPKGDPANADAPSSETPKPDAASATDGAAKSDAPAANPATTPAVAATPASKPATQPAATNPAAVDGPPAPPPSKWVLESEPKGDAGDSKVQSLLDALHPLRVQKYLAEKPKDAKSVGGYTLKVETRSTEGKPAQTFELKLNDPGSPGAVIGTYGDVTFEVERSFLEKLEGDFAKGAEAPEPPAGFPNFGGPGGGGLPPGFGGPQ
jgi:hypothetical protein